MPNTKKVVVVPKLSAYERRNLHSMGVETFVNLAELDPVHWKHQLRTSVFTTTTSKGLKPYAPGTIIRKLCGMRKLVEKMKIRDKLLLNIYHYKSHVDKKTRSKAGKIYSRWHPNAIMPPML